LGWFVEAVFCCTISTIPLADCIVEGAGPLLNIAEFEIPFAV
jgi:hypothetical protein